MTTTPRPATHSGYPLGAVRATRRGARSAARGSRLRRGAAWAGSALLLALGAAAGSSDPTFMTFESA
ncbi:MAG: hypothetical protein ABIW80_12950 [Lapillicoccus sp.]